jgi:peptidyl-tRNA hydrolase, PTH1 family
MFTMYIFGLGNPGKRYEHSRHNAGRDAVLYLVAKRNAVWERDRCCHAEMSTPFFVGEVFVKGVLSEGYMNHSGSVARCVLRNNAEQDTGVMGERMILIHDDIDLPVGTLRVAKGKGAGGHKGVEDVMRQLGTKDVLRVRIGVLPVGDDGQVRKPRAGEQIVRFVLRRGDEAYTAHLDTQCVQVYDAIEALCTMPHDRAVAYIHRTYSGAMPAL